MVTNITVVDIYINNNMQISLNKGSFVLLVESRMPPKRVASQSIVQIMEKKMKKERCSK